MSISYAVFCFPRFFHVIHLFFSTRCSSDLNYLLVYCLLCLLSFLFHETSVIMLILPFVRFIRITNRLLLAFVIFLILIVINGQFLSDELYLLSMGLESISDKTFYY